MEWQRDDGGRAEAGYTNLHDAGDCVARAIAIAADLPYRQVYDELARRSALVGGRRSARDGVKAKVYKPYFVELGFTWVPTMEIGSGCFVHLRANELPKGRLVVRLSRHLCAVIDGVVHDTSDPTRDGTRCVYGYWALPTDPYGQMTAAHGRRHHHDAGSRPCGRELPNALRLG